jgi:hypothetical protein
MKLKLNEWRAIDRALGIALAAYCRDKKEAIERGEMKLAEECERDEMQARELAHKINFELIG